MDKQMISPTTSGTVTEGDFTLYLQVRNSDSLDPKDRNLGLRDSLSGT